MRKVLIVGAGQAGLQLGLGLLERQYEVTIISARTPEDIREGRIMSTQAMFHDALETERALGLNMWEDAAPKAWGAGVSLGDEDRSRVVDWVGVLNNYFQSVDQRVKMPAWMEIFVKRGGVVRYHAIDPAGLDIVASEFDLTVIAAGRGDLVDMFERDPNRSPYDSPQRALAASYVHGAARRPEHPDLDAVRFNGIAGAGEFFVIPGYTFTGACEIPFFEAIPGGPLDVFRDRPGSAEHWSRMVELMREYVPWEYERFRNAWLTDAKATLAGEITPTVRHPVGELPSGNLVLGLADVVVSNDPITGQGANNAAKSATTYLHSIVERGNEPFDRRWMEETFERSWDEVRHATAWTNAMLQPSMEHVGNIFVVAETNEVVRSRFINGFNDPSDLSKWFLDPDSAADYLSRVA